MDSTGGLHLHQSNFPDAWNANPQIQTPDTAVYINVLEHIEDDETELKTIFNALAPGGRILIFVPALPFLMSSMDRGLGHFRRYTLAALATAGLFPFRGQLRVLSRCPSVRTLFWSGKRTMTRTSPIEFFQLIQL